MAAYLFDTETTGTHEPEVIEAAWIVVNNPVHLTVGRAWEQRFKPSKPIELGALAVHHILDEDLAHSPASSTFTLPFDMEYIIGHNVDYDWQVSGEPNVKRICTLALARAFVPGLDNYSQSALMYHFYRTQARVKLKKAHSALADVSNCKLLLDKLILLINATRKTPISNWHELWEESEAARIPLVISFGKHKGTAVRELPRDYKNWLLKQDTIDPYLKQAVRLSLGIA